MPARRFTDEGNSARIDLVFLGVRLDPADRRFHVIDTGGKAMLRREAIVDREPGETRLRQRRKQRLDVGLLVAPHEAAPMHQNACRERPFTGRDKSVERQADIAYLGKLNVALQTRNARRSRILGPGQARRDKKHENRCQGRMHFPGHADVSSSCSVRSEWTTIPISAAENRAGAATPCRKCPCGTRRRASGCTSRRCRLAAWRRRWWCRGR